MPTTNQESQPLLLRGEEVAEMLNLSRSMAYRWMQTGILPTIRPPRSRALRVPREALLRWIASQTREPTA
jgi:excisionase family DNA binding protein